MDALSKDTMGIALIVAGTVWFLWSLYAIRKGQLSEHWNTTEGTVTRAYVYEGIRKGDGTCPIIHYEYSVRDRSYKSDRVLWGFHLSGSRTSSEAVTGRYADGANVKVYYNPDNAGESVLEPGVKSGTVLSLAVSIVPIIAGVIYI